MKTFTSVLVLCALASTLTISCKKSMDLVSQDPNSQNQISTSNPIGSVVGELGDMTANAFCAAKTVPLCAGQTANVGSVSVQTTIDGKTYITYTVKGLWFIKELHLYVGEVEGIPVSGGGSAVPGQFPYTQTFTAPYVQTYTFVINGLPNTYAVAAHASLLKINSSGTVLDAQTGWGDGCNGKKITEQGSWGTFMNYTGASCTLVSAASEEVEICSHPEPRFFGVDPVYNVVTPWRDSTVTVAGYTYNETEGRAIANTQDPSGGPKDAKAGFKKVATLKLSHTNYILSPTLLTSVTTIETWLATQGKITPDNMPSAGSTVKNAIKMISAWIDAHNCPERR
jgi:hypothetical protein